MARYENYEEGKLYHSIYSRTICCVVNHHQWCKSLLDMAIWDFLDRKALLKSLCSNTTFITSWEYPLEDTWRTWLHGGLIQDLSYHSSHRHSKFSGKFNVFYSTSNARNFTSYTYIESMSLWHLRHNNIRIH